ncbi:unnamed protein product [Spirodela intermedia]|uniref:Leucine-rich repeat-containing N-terminal plant-type domain-containing protein n=1 Tax=Spirodela intermedia TaxID=51605 RepID=A0A7I8I959_SPIIN|nr:unnamed protein product [Spirodela intermedia]CAA6654179.1 unnamed protein product [Spirodela intermedia]
MGTAATSLSPVIGFLVVLFAAAEAILDPADFVALQSVRKALRDTPGSRFFASWDFTADPCRFSGVLCEEDRVVVLSLGDPRAGWPGLAGRLDPAVGRLSALAELSLVPGRVMGQLPATIAQLTNLRFLGLSRNFLAGAIPPELSLQPSFRSHPRGLGDLPSLSNLILGHNLLSGPVPQFHSPSLTRLDLKHNNLSGGVPALPPSLRYLSVSSNRLAGSVEQALPALAALNYLDLGMNQLSGAIPPAVFSFPLTHLQLQRNMFSGPVRHLSYNRLSGEVSPMLSTVRKLFLNNNLFTGKVPASLMERLMDSRIRVLYLQHNYLTGIEANLTSEIPTSSSLCLQYNCMVPPTGTACPFGGGGRRPGPPATASAAGDDSILEIPRRSKTHVTACDM